MKAIRNKVQLIGNLGADPEIRVMESGRKLARLNLATNEHFKDAQGAWQTETIWHHIAAWGPLAETIEKQLSKGQEIMIEGKLVTRQYTDKLGAKKYITEVQAHSMLVMDKRRAQPET